ncbi:helix-turn-helix transcriptional regulator [Luteolibacter sp. SL250]|uniref:helix-turn-helix transcriptional regulator n=1 Tax=Luteolibacter sp. SL250 TaxID=2995170 RepID=UPI00226FBF2C|nr:helix-turn-helix transcriptional regulator [Luteolibacter sp. SL250]WAC21002.1 helix-turn-helix transcriptional regulator [Luteolibacter sp. SL250]
MPPTATTPVKGPQGEFSHRVKIRLLELGWSVTQLARRIGVNRNTVSRAIHHDLYQPTRRLIAAELNIPL